MYFWNKTLHVSDSSSVHHQEFFCVHTAIVYVIHTYNIAVCTEKTSWWWIEELSETCRILFQKQIWEISASSWFYHKFFCVLKYNICICKRQKCFQNFLSVLGYKVWRPPGRPSDCFGRHPWPSSGDTTIQKVHWRSISKVPYSYTATFCVFYLNYILLFFPGIIQLFQVEY